MKVTIKLFAAYQEAYGIPELEWEVEPNTTVGDIGNRIRSKFPQLEPLAPITRYGINYDFVDADHPVQDGDEVVLIPPVSGG